MDKGGGLVFFFGLGLCFGKRKERRDTRRKVRVLLCFVVLQIVPLWRFFDVLAPRLDDIDSWLWDE